MTETTKAQIVARIKTVPGMSIVETRIIQLTLPMLEALYERHTTTPGHELYWKQIKTDLLEKQVLAGVVSSKHALWDIVAVTGESTKPRQCKVGSIRYDFGRNVEPIPCGELRYWRNVIHRAKRPEEVERDLGLFFPDFHK